MLLSSVGFIKYTRLSLWFSFDVPTSNCSQMQLGVAQVTIGIVDIFILLALELAYGALSVCRSGATSQSYRANNVSLAWATVEAAPSHDFLYCFILLFYDCLVLL